MKLIDYFIIAFLCSISVFISTSIYNEFFKTDGTEGVGGSNTSAANTQNDINNIALEKRLRNELKKELREELREEFKNQIKELKQQRNTTKKAVTIEDENAIQNNREKCSRYKSKNYNSLRQNEKNEVNELVEQTNMLVESYINEGKYAEDKHIPIYRALVDLYSIRNLSPRRNNILTSSMAEMNNVFVEYARSNTEKMSQHEAFKFLNEVLKNRKTSKKHKRILESIKLIINGQI